MSLPRARTGSGEPPPDPARPAPPLRRGTVLLVDDEPSILSVYRTLLAPDYECHVAEAVPAAQRILRTHAVDLVIADIMMPEADGFEMLRRVREVDLDVPVILVTGSPTLDAAIRAVEKGAFRFLVKPVSAGDLRAAAAIAIHHREFSRAHRQAREVLGHTGCLPSDAAGVEAWIEDTIGALNLHVQPILTLEGRELFAAEGLARFPGAGRPGIEDVLKVLEGAQRLQDFGRAARAQAAEIVRGMPGLPVFFLNLHQEDLLDEELYAADGALSWCAHRVVLEVTERGQVGALPDLGARLRRLRERGFRLAVDDLGAGNNGLATFSQVEPEFVKLDKVLVQGAPSNRRLFQIVGRLCELAREMGARIVAEGVETPAQEEAVRAAGAEFVQGWLYSRAVPPAEFAAAGFAPREGFAPVRSVGQRGADRA